MLRNFFFFDKTKLGAVHNGRPHSGERGVCPIYGKIHVIPMCIGYLVYFKIS